MRKPPEGGFSLGGWKGGLFVAGREVVVHRLARALQQAFVQLLVESDYPRISIRAITGLAGTSLGSFYEYFASKEDLARVCLHLRSKELLTALQQAVEAAGINTAISVNTAQAMDQKALHAAIEAAGDLKRLDAQFNAMQMPVESLGQLVDASGSRIALTVAAAQLGPIQLAEGRDVAVARMVRLMERAHARGCELVVFPELALTTFFP
eukprot:gene12274-15004_t